MGNSNSVTILYKSDAISLPFPDPSSTSKIQLNESAITSSNGTTLSNFVNSSLKNGINLQYIYLIELPQLKLINTFIGKHELYLQLGNSNKLHKLCTIEFGKIHIPTNTDQYGQTLLTSNNFIDFISLTSQDTTSDWNWNDIFNGNIKLYIGLIPITKESFTSNLTNLCDTSTYNLGYELSPTNQGNTNNQNNLGYVNHNNLGPIHSKTLESPTTHRESVNILPSHNVPTIPQYPINTLPYLQNNHILPSNIPTVLTSQHPSLIHPREQKHKHKHESKSSHENESFWQKYGSAIIWIIIIIIVILIIYAIVKSHKKSGKSSFGKCRKFNSNVYY